MELERYLIGPRAELPQVLDAREKRAERQGALLAMHPVTLVSFTLNIAGPVKVFPLTRWAFQEGICRIRDLCHSYGFSMVHTEETKKDTGWEAFFCVDAPAEKVKAALTALEEEDPLGRLFDLDVLDGQGRKLAREDLGLPGRTCLICGSPVFRCSRARAHTLRAVQERTCQILEEAYLKKRREELARAAVMALLREVQTTPKPGLVDLANTGAHRDMDASTFQKSALALEPYFREFADYEPELSPEKLLPGLREIGIRAERAMRSATGGVNTHKGVIFSMGILLAALGRWNGWEERPDRKGLREMCRRIAAPLAADFAHLEGVSHGEQLYLRHGVRGARGEALAGFPALFETALPALDKYKGAGWNEAGVVTLLHIMAEVEDSNMIARSSPQRAAELRREIGEKLARKARLRELTAWAAELDDRITKENISPGGSADILALACFVSALEEAGQMAVNE